MKSSTGIEIVCCIRLNSAQAYNHLAPIDRLPSISRVWIVRHKPVDCRERPLAKAKTLLATSRFRPIRFLQMQKLCFRPARRPEVKAFLSFNPFPYGLFSFIAAKCYGKAIHFGFIGDDWYKFAGGRFGILFSPILRLVELITACGEDMLTEMIRHSYDTSKLGVVPHGISVDAYPIADPKAALYTCIFVGQLIPRKRVDVLLDAFAILKRTHPSSRICIVGDGVLSDRLKRQALELKILENVDFVGFQEDVRPFLKQSKMIVITSSMEGLPFALVEGMCCGLIPLITPVGTIPNLIRHDENGLIFPVGDHKALGNQMLELLSDPERFERIRNTILGMRDLLSFEPVSKFWTEWLDRIV